MLCSNLGPPNPQVIHEGKTIRMERHVRADRGTKYRTEYVRSTTLMEIRTGKVLTSVIVPLLLNHLKVELGMGTHG